LRPKILKIPLILSKNPNERGQAFFLALSWLADELAVVAFRSHSHAVGAV